MNYLLILEQLFQSEPTYIKEQIMFFDMQFQVKCSALPKRTAVYDFIRQLPDRDNVIISLKSQNGMSYYFQKSGLGNQIKYTDFLESLCDDSVITVQIKIKKNITENQLSVYCYQLFINDICRGSLLEQLKIFHDLYDGLNYLLFEVFDETVMFCTKTMSFLSSGCITGLQFIDRQAQLDKCNMASGFYNMSEYRLLPDDFHIVFGRADKQLENLFEQFRTILSYLYIVSASSISLGKMQLQINGQNNELEFEHISNNLTAYEIYHWIFFDGNVIDKAAIARNILSLHNRDSEIININKTILSEIQSSFNLYLKEHVERYLMLKKDIVDYSYEITEKFGEYITELPNRFMKNLTTAAAFLFTIVLTNAVEQGSPERIFTSDVTIILEFVLLGSLIYLVLTCYELREKVKLAEYSVYNITKNYQDVLSESDINLIQNTLQNAKGKLDKAKCKWISGWFIGIVVLFIALTFISQDPLPIMQHFIQPRAMWVIDWFNMHMYSRST